MYEGKFKPWVHQADALRRMEGKEAFALLCAMRTGKTKMLLDDLGRLEDAGEVDDLLYQADQDTQEMLVGKKDIHQAMISIEQAYLSLRMMIQVRNKVLAAYEEIMRMQF